MKKQAVAKTEKASTALTLVLLLISIYVLIIGIFTEVKNPMLIVPFGVMFVFTGCKLCKIDYEMLHAIKLIK